MATGKDYLAKHHIPALFDQISKELLSHKPEEPITFVLSLLRQRKAQLNAASADQPKEEGASADAASASASAAPADVAVEVPPAADAEGSKAEDDAADPPLRHVESNLRRRAPKAHGALTLSDETTETAGRMEPAVLRDALLSGEGEVVVVDVRVEDYKGGHIKGSVHIPDVEANLSDLMTPEFDSVRWMVFVCMNGETFSPQAATAVLHALKSNGTGPEPLVLLGGFARWLKDYPDLVEDYDEQLWNNIWAQSGATSPIVAAAAAAANANAENAEKKEDKAEEKSAMVEETPAAGETVAAGGKEEALSAGTPAGGIPPSQSSRIKKAAPPGLGVLDIPVGPSKISREELRDALSGEGAESIVVVDVRAEDVAGGSVVGAKLIPLAEFEADVEGISKTILSGESAPSKVVFVCMNGELKSPAAASEFLGAARKEKGEEGPKVFVLTGGFAHWAEALGKNTKLTKNFDAVLWRNIWTASGIEVEEEVGKSKAKGKKLNLVLSPQEAPPRIMAPALVEMVKSGAVGKTVKVVDVRGEEHKGGHVKGSQNIAHDDFADKVSELVNAIKTNGIETVVVVCMNSEMHSPEAASALQKALRDDQATAQVSILAGGFAAVVHEYGNAEEADLIFDDLDRELWKSVWTAVGLLHPEDVASPQGPPKESAVPQEDAAPLAEAAPAEAAPAEAAPVEAAPAEASAAEAPAAEPANETAENPAKDPEGGVG